MERAKKVFSRKKNKVFRQSLSVIFACILFSPSVFSVPPINVSVSGVDPINLGVWDGSAVFTASDDICVTREDVSCGGACDYVVNIQSGSFTVSNGVDPAVPFRAYYNDQAGVSGNQELTLGVDLTGQTGIATTACAGSNGNFQIVFDSADLAILNPGIYTGSFRHKIFIDPKSRAGRGPVDVSMSIADVVQINGMNDIPLVLSGLFYQGSDDFCVYRNGAGGTYSITASSGNSPGTGLFTLSSGTSNANYNVYFIDSPGASSGSVALTEGVIRGGFVGTNVYSTACAAMNASVYIEAATANFIYGGVYGDTLTLTIMPE